MARSRRGYLPCLLLCLFACAFSPCRLPALALLARLLPLEALPRPPLLRLEGEDDFGWLDLSDFMIAP
jgi:hypothetical protein